MRWILIVCMVGMYLPSFGQQDNLSTLREQMRLHYEKGDYGKAMSYGLSLVTEAGNNYGLADARVGDAMESLGKLYLDMGEYATATAWYRKALGHRQQNSGMGSPEVGRCNAFLGEVHLETREYEYAERYLEKSVEMLEAAGQNYAEWLAQPLELLAALRYLQDRNEEAEGLYQRVMKIQEASLGLQSAPLARSLNNIGGVYQAQGKYQRAEAVFTHALYMQRSVLGQDHPETATTLVNLAVLYDQLGEFEKAEKHLKEALALREEKLPLTHPLIGQTLDNLISMYISIGSYEKAEACLDAVRAAREQAYGPDALALAPVFEKYASYHLAREDAAGAIQYLEKALEIRENRLGQRDPAVAASLYNIGKLCNALGRTGQARIALNRALDIYDTNQPGDQAVITAILAELMVADLQQGDMEMAEERLMLMLTIKERVFGESHPETEGVLEELSVLYGQMGQEDKKLAIDQRLRDIAGEGLR